MAKSIWKPGVKITRKEKKALRRLIPHPNRGRRLYQWKAENARIYRAMEGVMNDDGTLNLVEVTKRAKPFSLLAMKKEFYFEEFKPSGEKHYFPTTNEEIKGVHLRGQASDVSSVPKE